VIDEIGEDPRIGRRLLDPRRVLLVQLLRRRRRPRALREGWNVSGDPVAAEQDDRHRDGGPLRARTN
jgi:hypothetical protein